MVIFVSTNVNVTPFSYVHVWYMDDIKSSHVRRFRRFVSFWHKFIRCLQQHQHIEMSTTTDRQFVN